MTIYLVIIASCSVIIGCLFYFQVRVKRAWLARFASRKNLTFDEIYDEYFKQLSIPMKEAESLWVEAAKGLRILPGLLRPTDRIAVELNPYSAWKPFLGFWNESLYRTMENNISTRNINPDRIVTLSDYIILLTSSSSKSDMTQAGT